MRLCSETQRNTSELYITGHVGLALSEWKRPISCFPALASDSYNYLTPPVIDYSERYTSEDFFDEDLVFVLVIGESMTARRFGIHGICERDTTPLLSRRNDIICLNNMQSYGTSTYPSLTCILCGEPDTYGTQPKRSSFAAILKKHGFDNSLYLENTADFSLSRNMYVGFGSYMNRRVVLKGSMAGVVREIGRQIAAPSRKQLIIIENGTGHFPFHHGEEFSYYQPCNFQWNDLLSNHEEEVLNDYDNCVRSVDYMLDSLIRTLEKKNAVLFFVSDHGQFLGENGNWLHGNKSSPLLHHVASFIWFSKLYKDRHPEVVGHMETLRNVRLTHAYFFQSILSLCGIRSSIPDMPLDFTTMKITATDLGSKKEQDEAVLSYPPAPSA